MLRWLIGALIVLTIFASEQPPSKELKLTKEADLVEKGHLSAYTSRSYDLKLPGGMAKGSWLFLVVEGGDGNPLEAPVLEVSDKKSLKWDCSRADASVLCSISEIDLQETSSLVLDVTCVSLCDYTMTIYISSEMMLELGRPQIISFDDMPKGLEVVLKIPSNKTFEEFAVMATIDDPELLAQSIQLFMNVGEANVSAPTRTNFQHSGLPAWNDGKGIILRYPDVKEGNTIRLLIFTKGQVNLLLESYVSTNGLRSVSMYTPVRDTLPRFGTHIYRLNLAEFKSYIKNYSLTLKLIKFTGLPRMQLSASGEFQTGKTIVAVGTLSNQKFLLTPERRKDLNITGDLFIRIQSQEESVFQFVISLKHKNFLPLQEGEPEYSTIENDIVDNIIYTYSQSFEAEDKPKPTLRFDIYVRHDDYIDFHVRRCESLETNMSYACFLKNRSDWNKSISSDEIFGYFQNSFGESYFTFDYESDKCNISRLGNTTKYVCVFQVVMMRSPTSKPVVEYEVEMRQRLEAVRLRESFPFRSRISSGEVQIFNFTLAKFQEAKEVRFHMTIISGEVYMIVSTNPEEDLQKYNGSIWNSVSFKENITSVYYIYVVALEQSYFMINNHVVRQSATTAQVGTMVLQKDIAHTFTLESDNEEIQFGVQVPANYKPFTVEVQTFSGMVEYEVMSVHNGQTLWEFATKGTSPKTTLAASTDEFAVRVRSTLKPATFNIIYYYDNDHCFLYPMGQPLLISHQPNESTSDRCIEFHISKAEDLQIVMTEPTFVYQTEGTKMSYTINSTTTEITSRFTKISWDKIKIICRALSSNLKKFDQESCHLQINITNLPESHSFWLVVQYTSKNIVLFDGMLQRVRGKISEALSKNFVYELANNNPISVFIRAKAKGSYRILGTIVTQMQLKKSNGTEIFPAYGQSGNSTIFVSDTSQNGVTVLLVPSSSILQKHCGNDCVLLLSVFNKEAELDADFKIEVTQSTGSIEPGENSFGYVEKDTSRHYYTSVSEQTIILVNSFHEKCLSLNVLKFDNQLAVWKPLEHDPHETYMLISPPSQTEVGRFLIQVTGLAGCSYQLSLSSTRYQLYEMHEGVPFDLQLEQSDKVYFLYYHSDEESFRLLSLADYGDVHLSAEPLNASELNTIDTVKKSKRQFGFEQTMYGSLTISNRSKLFCSDCYYLLRISALSNVSTTVLLHTNSSAVSLRSGKVVKETLESGEDEDYTFNSAAAFNLTFDIMYGTLEVTVKRGLEKVEVLKPRTLFNRTLIQIKPNTTSDIEPLHQLDPANTYSIHVKCLGNALVGYSIAVAGENLPIKLRKGIPNNLHINRTQTCLEFPSYTGQDSLSIMIDSEQPIKNLRYWLDFTPAEGTVAGLTEPQTEVAEYNILMKLHSDPGVFKLCMQVFRAETDVSVLLLGAQVPVHLQVNKEVLFRSHPDNSTQVFEVYNPEKGYLMFEGFDCQGEVNIFGSEDLNRLATLQAELRFEHSKVWGHYIATVKVDSGLYFLAVDNRKFGGNEESLSILRFSHYQQGKHPYQYFDVAEGNLVKPRVDNLGQGKGVGVTLTVNKVMQLQRNSMKVLNHYYRFYISGSQTQLKQASQCNTVNILNKTIGFGAVLETTTGVVEAHFTPQDLMTLTLENGTMYFTVVCYVELEPEQKHNANLLKFIYGEGQLTLQAQANRQYTTFDFIMWLVMPAAVGLIVLLCTLRYCVRKSYMVSTELVEEVAQPNVPKAVSGAETNNVLAPSVSVSMTRITRTPPLTPPPQHNV